jgi:hypothetical protein
LRLESIADRVIFQGAWWGAAAQTFDEVRAVHIRPCLNTPGS